MQDLHAAPELAHLSDDRRAFVRAFDEAMGRAGYDFGGHIGPGYCWGRHMLIYRKTGAKSQNVVARIYIREDGVVLRLFLSGLDKHRAFLEASSQHLLEPFLNDQGRCNHCPERPDGGCQFRKSYTLFSQGIEKCSGVAFEYQVPQVAHMDEYMALLAEFYPRRKGGKIA